MRVADEGEFGLIARLRRMLEDRGEGLVKGLGDDTAVFEAAGSGLLAYTADAVVEGVHFDPAYTSWHSLGYKSLAVNISDLAAMGASPPAFAVVVLGLMAESEVETVEEIYGGLMDCSREFSCSVVGGDIVRSPQYMFISISLVGSIPGDVFLTRDAAKPGQTIMVTGTLGDSFLGLKWLVGGGGDSNPCARRHLYPRPRLREGMRARESGAAACIDVSDGLLRDLGHICEESGAGAEVELEKVPLSAAARETARELGEDASGAALFGGEDYELLIVAEEDRVPAMRDELGLTVIGRITDKEGVAVLDSAGRHLDIHRAGYEHFKEG